MTSAHIGKPSPLQLLSATCLVVALLALLGPLGADSRAQADPADDKFLAILKSDGIVHDSPQAAIEAGHKACEYLDMGESPTGVGYEVMFSSSLPDYDSGYFVGAAIRAYCPRHLAEIPH